VIRQVLQSVPFRPFRLRLADGREFAVTHPDYIAIGENGRSILHYDSERDNTTTILEPLLIISIEYPPPLSATEIPNGATP
jgi:hypothetical protein